MDDLFYVFCYKSWHYDVERFNVISEVEQQGVILAQLLNFSCKQGGWDYFFYYLKDKHIDFDLAETLVSSLISKELLENFKEAKNRYKEKGFYEDYDDLSEVLIDSEDELRETIDKFLNNNSELYNR